jgi:hypothetical protein
MRHFDVPLPLKRAPSSATSERQLYALKHFLHTSNVDRSQYSSPKLQFYEIFLSLHALTVNFSHHSSSKFQSHELSLSARFNRRLSIAVNTVSQKNSLRFQKSQESTSEAKENMSDIIDTDPTQTVARSTAPVIVDTLLESLLDISIHDGSLRFVCISLSLTFIILTLPSGPTTTNPPSPVPGQSATLARSARRYGHPLSLI